ncbi:MAG: capsular polysaccharide transport system ATP-binding protein [Campylobacterota bacterium]|nr:capsular polysaccharide transport system ATP-binding protein [Campylobacterota bacterium]
MIKLINATKYYKTQNENKYILKDVNLEIPSGVNIGILGKNGAGKSTLLKMLAGIDFPNSGEIVSDKSFSWVMGLTKGIQPFMTGRQNVKFICRIYGKSEEQIKKIALYVKEFSELGDYFEMPISSYSSGMKSRLSFAMSLAFDFDYLIIDEILSVGDAAFKKKSQKALQDKMQKCNILIVSHSMETLRELCDAGLLVDDGKLRYYTDIEDAIYAYNNINKVQAKKVKCSDGSTFDNIGDAARHYKVHPTSVRQALNQNNGSHQFLKKVFWFENTDEPKFQNWQNIKEGMVLTSNGIIFNSSKEAYYFFKEAGKNIELEEDHIEKALKNDGVSDKLKIKFYYLSEYIWEKS